MGFRRSLGKPEAYDEWLSWIYSFYRAQWQVPPVTASKEFVRRVLGKRFPLSARAFQVTGTNGKGTVAAWTEELLLQQGRQVICTTSPHLYSVRERVRIRGRSISKDDLCAVLSALYASICRLDREGFSPRPFQVLIWAALFIQAELGPDCVGVYEVGAGGGTDATNVFSIGTVALTRITDDHLHDFGGSIESVALEKLGLCSRGKTLFHQPQIARIGEMIKTQAAIKGFVASEISRDASFQTRRRFRAEWDLANFLLAREAVGDYGELSLAAQRRVEARLPCRHQRLQVSSTEFILDIAHNIDGIAKMLELIVRTESTVALVGFSRNAKWRECLSQVVRSRLFVAIFAVRYSRASPVAPSDLAGLFPEEVSPYRSFLTAVDVIVRRRFRYCYVFGHPCVCADMERALWRLGFPGSISRREMDPLQPWMNESW